jgi:pyruvate/2-oxoglutarate/acetoin dehydrogenase E1 component
VPCPVFVRSVAMEGKIGPVAGSSHHSLYHRMPGIKIASPMTPKEYKKIYENFMREEEVYYVSEHRGSFNNEKELPDIILDKTQLVVFAISITRFEARKAIEILNKGKKFKISLSNILWIKPLKINKKIINKLKKAKYGGLIIDDDYEDGVAKSIANDLSLLTNKKIHTLGLKNKSAGFSMKGDNLPPSHKEIIKKIKKIIS